MNFKKHISILTALLILVSNSGLAFNVHYCGGEIASVTLNTAIASQDLEMSCCGIVAKESNCCKNKIIKSEVKTDQIIVKSLTVESSFMPAFNDWKPLVYTSDLNFKKREITPYYCDANAPPLYLLYSQYTFYA